MGVFLRLAAVPFLGTAFPKSKASCGQSNARSGKVEELLSVLWPHVGAMNCGSDARPLVWILLRYANRMLGFRELKGDPRLLARCMMLSTVCAVRLLCDVKGGAE